MSSLMCHGLWPSCLDQFAQVTGTDSKTAPRIALGNELVFNPLMKPSIFLHFLLLKRAVYDYSAYLFFSNLRLVLCLDLSPFSNALLDLKAFLDASFLPHSHFYSQFHHFSFPRGLIQIIFRHHPPAQSQSSMSLSQTLGWVRWLSLCQCGWGDSTRWWKPDHTPPSRADRARMNQSMENASALGIKVGKVNHVLWKAHNFCRSFLDRQFSKSYHLHMCS